MQTAIHEWSGLIAVVSIALWFIVPGKRASLRRFWYSPIPPSAGNALHDTLSLIFGIAWIAFVATMFADAWIAVVLFLAVGIVVLVFEMRR